MSRRAYLGSWFGCSFGVVVLLSLACACATKPPLVVPPPTVAEPLTMIKEPTAPETKIVNVVDDYNGTKVTDPYRWLEDSDSQDVKTWTDAQNARTRAVLDVIPGRDALTSKIRALLEIGFVTGPAVRTVRPGLRRYFHTKREGAQNQPILYVRDGAAAHDRVLLDASTLSADGTTAVDWWYPSRDGTLVAWGRSESGSEDSVLYIRDVATGKDLSDRIDRTRHASVAWMPDGKAFYYSRYPEAGTVKAGDEKYFSKIYFHKLGDDPKNDRKIYERTEKTDVPQVIVSPNGRWLVIRVHEGWDKSDVFLRDLSKGDDAPLVAVADGKHALFEPTPRNDKLYILTNDGAPRYELYAVDYADVARDKWTKVIAEGADVLQDVSVSDREIIATYMHDASTRIERFTKAGKSIAPIDLGAIGTAGVSTPLEGDEAFVGFTSFVEPYRVMRFDLTKKTPQSELWDAVGTRFDARDFVVKQTAAISKDGTRVPMFIISKKDITLDGKNPTALYGYGGFNVNQTPAFSPRALSVVERGGIWVSAVLRGGGEFGEAWHEAGMLAKKQNVFDDFIACAETLIRDRYTSPDKLALVGGSNGGLLVSAMAVQRPDLFRAGLALVPLTDMLRYHRFRIGKLWVSEYGSADDPAQFPFLYAYSPYHHVSEGTRYPAILFTTAESDSRVDPLHARKMAARMEAVQNDPTRPILLRVETKAGHGAGKPVSKQVEEQTDELSFLFSQLGMVGEDPIKEPTKEGDIK